MRLRYSAIEPFLHNPVETQMQVFNNLIGSAQFTEFGKAHNFETINNNMVEQLQVLRTAAASGDAAAFATAYGQTGQTCGTCHRPYRQRTS